MRVPNPAEPTTRKCEHGNYWPTDHEIAYGCGFCNSTADTGETRPGLNLDLLHGLYAGLKTDAMKEAFGKELIAYLYSVSRRVRTNHDAKYQKYPNSGYRKLDDIVQNVAASVWENLDKFKGDSTFSTWVYQAVINKSIDMSKQSMNLRERLLFDDTYKGTKVHKTEAKLTLKSLISKLTDDDRAHVQMKLDGLTDEEISEAFGIELRTGQQRWLRLKKHMRDLSTQRGPEQGSGGVHSRTPAFSLSSTNYKRF